MLNSSLWVWLVAVVLLVEFCLIVEGVPISTDKPFPVPPPVKPLPAVMETSAFFLAVSNCFGVTALSVLVVSLSAANCTTPFAVVEASTPLKVNELPGVVLPPVIPLEV